MARKTRPYVKIDQSLGDHQRVVQIAPKQYLAAIGLHVLGIGWCDRMRTDGRIPKHMLQKIVVGTFAGALSELIRVGLWTEDGDEYEIHDYLDWQDSASDIETRSENARKGASTRWGKATSNAKRIADSTAPEPNLTEPNREEPSRARANALPTCLSEVKEGTQWADADGHWHDSPASSFWSTLESERGGLLAPKDTGIFAAIVSETCPADCCKDSESVGSCLDVLVKAASKTKGRPSPLFRRICEEDR